MARPHTTTRILVGAVGEFADGDRRLVRHENRTIVAPLEHQSSKAQVEPALQLLALTVAIKTMRLEDRPDILLEHWGGGVRSGNNQQEETERTEKP